jgi:hypothetical protein
MSYLPKSSAVSGLVYGIVVGGHDADAPTDYSGNIRVYFPSIHGKDVNVKHLAYSPRLMSPTRAAQQEFPGGLDPGSLVVAMKDTGSNQCQIIGLANDLNNNDQTIEGNMSLLQNIAMYLTMPIQVLPPPESYETVEGGARVRRIREKDQLWNHGMTKGLPTHGAMYNMAGMTIPKVASVATAVQSFDNLISSSMMGNLPGAVMSLGVLLSSILNNKNNSKKLYGGMNPSTIAAFNSMSYLIQSVEQKEGAGFMTGTRVNSDVYTTNAIGLLGQATGIGGLVNTFQRLQYDTSLFGLGSLAPVITPLTTSAGTVYRSYSPSGQMMTYTPLAVATAAKAVATLLGGGSTFPSIIPGQNFFGSGAGTMSQMFQFMPPQARAAAFTMMTALQASQSLQNIAQGGRVNVTGGNPIQRMFPGI